LKSALDTNVIVYLIGSEPSSAGSPEGRTQERSHRDLRRRLFRITGRNSCRDIWHEAGLPRRLLTDFVIGVHALRRADRLITFDAGGYRRDFPELQIAPGRAQ
jgi:predicted nucleic acid-binding protein